MGTVIVLPREVDLRDLDLPCLSEKGLPLCYMSDYSVLALMVDKFPKAARLLEEHRFRLTRGPRDLSVTVENAVHMQKMLGVLDNGGIDFTLSDVASHFYQG
jgi:hypothetical protein